MLTEICWPSTLAFHLLLCTPPPSVRCGVGWGGGGPGKIGGDEGRETGGDG